MCGIVGIVDHGEGDLDRLTAAMRDTLVHRGPDDAGLASWPEHGVALGHRRLSIIDLSAASRQPMCNEDGTVWLVFNGEIYNYRALRRTLIELGHAFRSQGDSEVILHTYEQWGVAGVERLTGMFAYGIWDLTRRRLVLARDRLGIKPLYYWHDDSRLLFASEPRAILAHPRVPCRPDMEALGDYLSYGYVPWDRAAFAGMRKLPPGHVLVYEARSISVREYWRLEPSEAVADPALGETLRSVVVDAVESHLVSDVPLGSFLSGGVDSSLVTAIASRARSEPLRTITVGFDRDTAELPYAREVAERYGTNHVEEQVALRAAFDLLTEITATYDEPLADASAIPTYQLCRAARTQVTVALSGDGGDELFAGYGWYQESRSLPLASVASRLVDGLRAWPKLARLGALRRRCGEPEPARHFRSLGLFDDWEQARLLGTVLQDALAGHDPLWFPRRLYRPDLPRLTALQLLDLRSFLPDDILVKVDRASMAHSLEVRPPLLDHRVVELAFRIPPDQQRSDGSGKRFLKETFAAELPEAVRNRRKKGFSPPIAAWFKSGLWESTRSRITAGRLARTGLIDPTFVDSMVTNYTYRRWAKVWALLVLEDWYRRWFD